MLLLHLASEAHMKDLALCREESSIVEVVPIAEDEFQRAKSNAI
jgi:hypothetical protein